MPSKKEEDFKVTLLSRQRSGMHLEFFNKDSSLQSIQVPIFSSLTPNKHITPFRNATCLETCCVYDIQDLMHIYKKSSKQSSEEIVCDFCENHINLQDFHLDCTLKEIIDYVWEMHDKTGSPMYIDSVIIARDGYWQPNWQDISEDIETSLRALFPKSLRVKRENSRNNLKASINLENHMLQTNSTPKPRASLLLTYSKVGPMKEAETKSAKISSLEESHHINNTWKDPESAVIKQNNAEKDSTFKVLVNDTEIDGSSSELKQKKKHLSTETNIMSNEKQPDSLNLVQVEQAKSDDNNNISAKNARLPRKSLLMTFSSGHKESPKVSVNGVPDTMDAVIKERIGSRRKFCMATTNPILNSKDKVEDSVDEASPLINMKKVELINIEDHPHNLHKSADVISHKKIETTLNEILSAPDIERKESVNLKDRLYHSSINSGPTLKNNIKTSSIEISPSTDPKKRQPVKLKDPFHLSKIEISPIIEKLESSKQGLTSGIMPEVKVRKNHVLKRGPTKQDQYYTELQTKSSSYREETLRKAPSSLLHKLPNDKQSVPIVSIDLSIDLDDFNNAHKSPKVKITSPKLIMKSTRLPPIQKGISEKAFPLVLTSNQEQTASTNNLNTLKDLFSGFKMTGSVDSSLASFGFLSLNKQSKIVSENNTSFNPAYAKEKIKILKKLTTIVNEQKEKLSKENHKKHDKAGWLHEFGKLLDNDLIETIRSLA